MGQPQLLPNKGRIASALPSILIYGTRQPQLLPNKGRIASALPSILVYGINTAFAKQIIDDILDAHRTQKFAQFWDVVRPGYRAGIFKLSMRG
jgi:hypothetical protein